LADDPLPAWVRPAPDGAILRVHARPGAAKPGVAGLHGDAVAVRVRARPVEGAANRALVDVLAEALRVAPSALAIESGTHGREKRVRVRGCDAATVVARLAPLLVR
jgi:hypothetical protein